MEFGGPMMHVKSVHIRAFKGLADVELKDCGRVNAFVGKNNAGKSSLLHAIDMAGLALVHRNWNAFEPKVAIHDMFSKVGAFEIALQCGRYEPGQFRILADPTFVPIVDPSHPDSTPIRTVLIRPDAAMSESKRTHRTPDYVRQHVAGRD